MRDSKLIERSLLFSCEAADLETGGDQRETDRADVAASATASLEISRRPMRLAEQPQDEVNHEEIFRVTP
jgi:hypothetical protein